MNSEIKRHHVPRLEGPLMSTLPYDIICSKKLVSDAALHLTEGTEGDVAMVFMCGKWNTSAGQVLEVVQEGIFISQLPRGFISLLPIKSHNII
ncbi:hypothetical protein ACFX12_008081 [Malus domestica]